MKTYLEVPFAQKDRAKALGARFDMSRKKWYCPDGVDLMKFKQWIPKDLMRNRNVADAKRRHRDRNTAGLDR
jgi:hypothetical protein